MLAQVFEQMELDGVEPDMVTCCSLLKALERGGEWALAEQLFCQVRPCSHFRCRVSHQAAREDEHQPLSKCAGTMMLQGGQSMMNSPCPRAVPPSRTSG